MGRRSHAYSLLVEHIFDNGIPGLQSQLTWTYFSSYVTDLLPILYRLRSTAEPAQRANLYQHVPQITSLKSLLLLLVVPSTDARHLKRDTRARDNCLRAVVTSNAAPRNAQGSSDCSSYQITTVATCVTSSVVSVTVTATAPATTQTAVTSTRTITSLTTASTTTMHSRTLISTVRSTTTVVSAPTVVVQQGAAAQKVKRGIEGLCPECVDLELPRGFFGTVTSPLLPFDPLSPQPKQPVLPVEGPHQPS